MMKLLLVLLVFGTDALVKQEKKPATVKAVEVKASVKPMCDKGAQLTEGRWANVGKRAHSQEMDYAQEGCPTLGKNDAALMVYEPQNCSLPLFSKHVEKMPKRVVFIGDSISDAHAQSFAWFLDETRPDDYKKCKHNIGEMRALIKANLTSAGFSEEEVQATDAFIGSQNAGKKWNLHEWWGCQSKTAFILADKPPPQKAVKGFMHAVRNFYEEPLGPDDVVVMNFGVWLGSTVQPYTDLLQKKNKGKAKAKAKAGLSLDAETESIKLMMEQVKSWGKDAPKLIYRETTPGHWNSWDGYYTPEAFRSTFNQCKRLGPKELALVQTKPHGLYAKTTLMFHEAAEKAGMAIDGVQLEYMPVYNAAMQRSDDHAVMFGDHFGKRDCTHFCARGPTNRFMNSALLALASGMLKRSDDLKKTTVASV